MLKRTLLIVSISTLAIACGTKFSKKGDSPAATTPGENQTPPPVAPAAQNYNGQQLDPNTGLNGMGHWITLSDQRFFVPDRNQLQNQNDWQPYQDGRWTYDNQRGWTWVSNDPWGWMTDHYGVWRHHRQYGWIWLPFRDMRYEPHTVTWFDQGDYIGWYPMFDGYAQAYTLNDRYGFDDGYWQGRSAILSISGSAFGFNFGFTMINREQVTYENVRTHIIRDRRVVLNNVYLAHQGDRIHRVGRHPGGDQHRSHDFVQRYSRHRAPVGDAQVVNSRGGARFLQPFNGRSGGNNDRRDNDRRDHDRRDNDRRDHDRRDHDRRDDQRPNRGNTNPPVVQPSRPSGIINPPIAQPSRPQPPVLPPPRRDNPPAQTQPQQPRSGGFTPAVIPPKPDQPSAQQPPAQQQPQRGGDRGQRPQGGDRDERKGDDNRKEKKENDGDENGRRRRTT